MKVYVAIGIYTSTDMTRHKIESGDSLTQTEVFTTEEEAKEYLCKEFVKIINGEVFYCCYEIDESYGPGYKVYDFPEEYDELDFDTYFEAYDNPEYPGTRQVRLRKMFETEYDDLKRIVYLSNDRYGDFASVREFHILEKNLMV
jgi:hypothetical protein